MNLSKDFLMTKLRELLLEDKIRLWLPPYTTEDKEEKEASSRVLIEKYSLQLKFAYEDVAEAFEELRLHSLTKFEERAKFQEKGLATLRVKLTGNSENKTNKSVPIECSLGVSGLDLKELIAAKFEIPKDNLKLICKGKVIQEGRTLDEQFVKNGYELMAMCTAVSEAQVLQQDSDMVQVQKTRRAAELLSNKADDDDDFNVQIADQTGQPINLPRGEKKALTIAMTLHEKGRAVLKKKKVTLALPLFLEADEEFSKCRSDILNAVDNYAILCLDIVWCYFLLKNLDQLPNAENRLKKSEECFKRSYGEKMERLAAIKGGTGTEQALFMRLYLLQGIVAYHQGQVLQARNLLGRAQFVLTLLHVDPEKLEAVMVMGFTEREARLALRAKNGNIQQAVDDIVEKRKERKKIKKKSDREWIARVRAKKLGKTIKGKPVDISQYDNLVAMDFAAGAAAEALRQTDNNFDAALEYLSSHPENSSLPDPESRVKITDEMIQQVVNLGFPPGLVMKVLEKFSGDCNLAIDELLQNNGAVSDSDMSTASATASDISQASTSAAAPSEQRRKENREIKDEIFDIEEDENDYLDLTLEDEREALLTYQGMVDSLSEIK